MKLINQIKNSINLKKFMIELDGKRKSLKKVI